MSAGGMSRICRKILRIVNSALDARCEGRRTNLVVAEPDLAISDRNVEDVIDEGLCAPGSLGDGEDLSEQTNAEATDVSLCA